VIENLRRGGQRVVVVVEVEKEEFNEQSEERERCRDSETGAARPPKTSLALARQDMPQCRSNYPQMFTLIA
jgi:hypothetical protein